MSKINKVFGFLKASGTRRHQQGMTSDRAVTSSGLFGSNGNELGEWILQSSVRQGKLFGNHVMTCSGMFVSQGLKDS
jgi:hypothetical protein